MHTPGPGLHRAPVLSPVVVVVSGGRRVPGVSSAVHPEHHEAAQEAEEATNNVENESGGDVGEDREAAHDAEDDHGQDVDAAPHDPAQHHHVLLLTRKKGIYSTPLESQL